MLWHLHCNRFRGESCTFENFETLQHNEEEFVHYTNPIINNNNNNSDYKKENNNKLKINACIIIIII